MAHICRCFYRLAVKTLYLIPVIIHYRQSLVQMKLPVISILVLTFIIIQLSLIHISTGHSVAISHSSLVKISSFSGRTKVRAMTLVVWAW